MATIKTVALILKTMNWRDSSRIITIFTKNNGRLDVIAKGANRYRSKYFGILEPLNLVEVVVYYSETRDLQMLGKAELESSFSGIKSNLEKTGFAFAILEIVYTFFKDHNPATEFYEFVVFILGEIERGRLTNIYFWYFMLKLTSYLGFKPEFKSCRLCGKKITGRLVYFSFDSGAVICTGCGRAGQRNYQMPSSMCHYLEHLQRTHYKKIGNIVTPELDYFEITRFLQMYLRYHTNEKLELKALKYFKLN